MLAAGAADGAHAKARHLTGRLIIQTKAGVDAERVLEEARRRVRAPRMKMRHMRGARLGVIDVAPAALEKIEAVLAADPRVKFVERDRIVPPARIANDTAYPGQYHLQAIGAPAAWDIAIGSADAPIAILDSGVDASHPDLAARVLPGRNVYDDNDDTRDVSGHGTLVAGVVAAVTNNGAGVSGVTWLNPILPVRITDLDGNASYATIAEGLVWASDRGARVANVSYAVFGARAVSAAAEYFVRHGGLVFAAGGNDGLEHADAANDWVVSVAATDRGDTRADFSSYGAYIDLAAPGVDVVSTARGGGYAAVSGTSIASPIAAGAAALVFAANPSLAPITAEDLLKGNSIDLGSPGYDPYHGWGLVDAGSAVAAAALLSVTGAHAPDTHAPRVALRVSRARRGIASGVVFVRVHARDDVAVTRVALAVNGSEVAVREGPSVRGFRYVWDTTAVTNGRYELIATASDASGNEASSLPVTVVVRNSAS